MVSQSLCHCTLRHWCRCGRVPTLSSNTQRRPSRAMSIVHKRHEVSTRCPTPHGMLPVTNDPLATRTVMLAVSTSPQRAVKLYCGSHQYGFASACLCRLTSSSTFLLTQPLIQLEALVRALVELPHSAWLPNAPRFPSAPCGLSHLPIVTPSHMTGHGFFRSAIVVC